MAHQLEDVRVGLRMVVFTGPVRDLGGGVQATPSAWLRHTRLAEQGSPEKCWQARVVAPAAAPSAASRRGETRMGC